MRNMLIVGCIHVLANAAAGAAAIPSQNGGAAGTTAPSASAILYSDVPIGNWAYSAIASLQAHRILIGYPAGYFTGASARSRYALAVAANRCANAVLTSNPTPATSQEAPGPDGSVPAGDLKALRKLFLEFQPQLIALGVDWKTAETGLHKLQDKKLHADVAEALAKFAPNPEDKTNEFDEIKRPSWVYDSIQQLSQWKIPRGRILTRYEFSVAIKRSCDAFYSAEHDHSDAGLSEKAVVTLKLNDVVELHKLVRSFHRELAQLGVDLKAVEDYLSKAEEKRIQADEIIDARPPEVK